ncbi:MAG: aminotransferase class V-fold PLP-dependent enzyme, partial [Bacteroidota bacterium]
MQNRRKFIRQISSVTGALTIGSLWTEAHAQKLEQEIQRIAPLSIEERVLDEQFWATIKQAYTVSATMLNLNNGGVSPQPLVVQQAVERYNRLCNETPSYFMWRVLDKGREPLRQKLADLAGCQADEIAINRNASEALETIIFGLPLKAGDEVVLTNKDYPNMMNAWKQRELRDGIKLSWIDLKLPQEDEGQLVDIFVKRFTEKTKVVHLTHMINWSGQILPVAKIATEAQKRGIEVLVDGAHTFAHLNYKILDLKADYFGTSLHKWLCAPFGSGMLYVRRPKIKKVFPLLAAPDPMSGNIRKFESLGTRSFAIEQAIAQAIDFHLMIGSKLKHQRLQYLKNYWAKRVVDLPNVHLHTSLDPRFGSAIALLSIDGISPTELHNTLFRKHYIHTTTIDWKGLLGVRITPNVYVLTKDLDRLINAIRSIAKAALE